jgi:large subunit ribosomal protein L3
MASNVKGILWREARYDPSVWDDDNRVVPGDRHRGRPLRGHGDPHPDTDGYNAVQIGFGAIDPRKASKPMRGHFEQAGVTPRRHLLRAAVPEDALRVHPRPGDRRPTSSKLVPLVDVTGTTKGKGYAGAMKRHGFRGVRASHGAHRNAPLSPAPSVAAPLLVACSRAFACRAAWVGHADTTQNLVVQAVDAERGIILVKGAIPGPTVPGLCSGRNAVKVNS